MASSAATARLAWVMTAIKVLESNPDTSDEEIRRGLEGNLCRCTGYHNIVKSVLYAAQLKQGVASTEGANA